MTKINDMKDSNYPKIVEISKRKQPFNVDIKDPNFDKPLSELNKEIRQPKHGILIFKVR